MLNSSLQDSREAIAEEAKEYGYDIPILMDANQLVGEQLGVTRTAEVFVIDPKTWKVVYRGPLDDRLDYGTQKAGATTPGPPTPSRRRWPAGRPWPPTQAEPGCLIDFPERGKRAQPRSPTPRTSRRSSRRSASPATRKAASARSP